TARAALAAADGEVGRHRRRASARGARARRLHVVLPELREQAPRGVPARRGHRQGFAAGLRALLRRRGRAHVQALRHRDAAEVTVAAPRFSPGLAGARSLDAEDELASLRREFELPRERGRTLIYLCGHSLGLMPRGARRAVETELDRWSALGVDGHFPDAYPKRGRARPVRDAHGGWLDYHVQFTPLLADLVGAGRDEVVAMRCSRSASATAASSSIARVTKHCSRSTARASRSCSCPGCSISPANASTSLRTRRPRSATAAVSASTSRTRSATCRS